MELIQQMITILIYSLIIILECIIIKMTKLLYKSDSTNDYILFFIISNIVLVCITVIFTLQLYNK